MPSAHSAGSRLQRLIDLYGSDYRAISDERVHARLATCGSLLIFGAGQNGGQVLSMMGEAGLRPRAFIDDTPRKVGQFRDGVPVMGLEAAAALPDPVAVVSIFSPAADFLPISQRLRAAGVEAVSLFQFLWAHGRTSLPFYFVDAPEALVEARDALLWLSDRLIDERSRELLLAQVEFRLSLRHEALPPWNFTRVAPPDDWPTFHVIDAGAFDGDTLAPLVRTHGSKILGAIALEPDPATFERLNANLAVAQPLARGPLLALKAAADRQGGRRTFANAGNPGSSFAEQGITVDTVAVDDLVAAKCPPQARLYIKFDVEGAEAEALEGARATICVRRPFLSIAAYHRPSDLWELARQVSGMDDGYRFLLRSHGGDGADLTLYAVPPGEGAEGARADG